MQHSIKCKIKEWRCLQICSDSGYHRAETGHPPFALSHRIHEYNKIFVLCHYFCVKGWGRRLLLCSNRSQNSNSHPLSTRSRWPWTWGIPGLQKSLEFSLMGSSAPWFFPVCELMLLVRCLPPLLGHIQEEEIVFPHSLLYLKCQKFSRYSICWRRKWMQGGMVRWIRFSLGIPGDTEKPGLTLSKAENVCISIKLWINNIPTLFLYLRLFRLFCLSITM